MICNKKVKLTEGEIKALVKDWHYQQVEVDLNQVTVEREIRAMESALSKYNVEQLGQMPTEREDGAMRILV